MTARYLLNLSLALGITGVLGCTAGATKDTGDDDDDTQGDDDDDDTTGTGGTGLGDDDDDARVDELDLMLYYAYFEISGGNLVAGEIGAFFATEAWSGSFSDTEESCSLYITADVDTGGALAGVATVDPVISVPAKGAKFGTDCGKNFGLDPYVAAFAVAPSGTSFTTATTAGVSAVIDAEMQEIIDAYPSYYTVDSMFSYWHAPLLKTPDTTGYGGYAQDDSKNDIPGSDVRAAGTLPDGTFFVFGPYVNIDGFFDGYTK